VKCGFFLRKKPLSIELPEYSYWRTALPPVVVAAYGVVGVIVYGRIAVRIGIWPAIVGAITAALMERRAAGIKALRQTGCLPRADRGDC
jgi:hypothetical protein